MMSSLVDIIIIALILGVVVYAYLVDRRVRQLMSVLHELAPMVDDFSAAVDRSADSVGVMRSMTDTLKNQVKSEPDARFRSFRAKERKEHFEDRPKGGTNINDKSDLVRSFFDTARGRKT